MEEGIFDYVINNDFETLQSKIKTLPVKQRTSLVDRIYKNNESKYNNSSCLLISCLQNNLKIIEYLVNECKCDLEMMVVLKNSEDWDNLTFFTNYTNTGYKACFNLNATCLYHLCRNTFNENFEAVKLLIRLGANVNTRTESHFNSTPLMAACSRNNLKLVKFLIEEAKADVNVLDNKAETCLFYAARNLEDSLELIKYLVKKGLDINQTNRYGQTILNFLVETTRNDSFKYIISHNPYVQTYLRPDCLLIRAALNADTEKFNMLFKQFNFDPVVSIFGLEIIGCRLIEQPSGIKTGLFYWDLSLDERNYFKIYKTPFRIDGFMSEFNSSDDLKRIEKCPLEILMQNLLIRERVLLKFNEPNRFATLDFYQSLNLENLKSNLENFFFHNRDRVQYLWSLFMSLQVKYLKPLDESIRTNLINLSFYMNYLQTNRKFKRFNLTYEYTFRVLKFCFHEIKRVCDILGDDKILFKNRIEFVTIGFDDLFEYNDERLAKKRVKHETCVSKAHFYVFQNLETFKKISVCMIRLLVTYDLDPQTRDELNIIVRNLVLFDKCFKGEMSILAMSLKQNLLKDFEYSNQFKTYDPVSVKCVEYFLKSGADPDSKEFMNRKSNNNCVNSCLVSRDVAKSKGLCDTLIRMFLNYGAHLDFKNDSYQTFIQKYESKYLSLFHDKFKHVTLKCLCAQVLKQNEKFKVDLPNFLVDFVDKH